MNKRENQIVAFHDLLEAPDRAEIARQAATLIETSLPELYRAIPKPHEDIEKLIASQLQLENSECHDPLIILRERQVLAVASFFPCASLAIRQNTSMTDIYRALSKDQRAHFLAEIASQGNSIETLGDHDGVYIGRIAVASDERRKGYGERLIRHIAELNPRQSVFLHVDRENVGAVAFYERLGFQFLSEGAYSKRAMRWNY